MKMVENRKQFKFFWNIYNNCCCGEELCVSHMESNQNLSPVNVVMPKVVGSKPLPFTQFYLSQSEQAHKTQLSSH